jgi:hypothetical protein
MYQMKGLAIWNTHVKYESPSAYQWSIMSKVKVFEKNIKLKGQKVKIMAWNKGLAIRNTYVKHESSGIYQSKVTSKIKVCWRTDKRIDGRSELPNLKIRYWHCQACRLI